MSFTRNHFLRHRPWLYHFTHPDNVDMLRQEMAMLSAVAWVARANAFEPGQVPNPHAFLGAPRLGPVPLRVGAGQVVTLNDLLPLQHRSSFYRLRGRYEDFLRCLNGLVFFWPGDEDGPTPKGDLAETFEDLYEHYCLLRIPTVDSWGDASTIRFCRYNSGAPQARDRIVRGSHIFVTRENINTRHVAEVVFDHQLDLAGSAQWRPPGSTTWEPLSDHRLQNFHATDYRRTTSPNTASQLLPH